MFKHVSVLFFLHSFFFFWCCCFFVFTVTGKIVPFSSQNSLTFKNAINYKVHGCESHNTQEPSWMTLKSILLIQHSHVKLQLTFKKLSQSNSLKLLREKAKTQEIRQGKKKVPGLFLQFLCFGSV